MNEDKLHNTALYYMDCMRQKHESITHEPLSLDEFLDKYAITLTMQDLYLGQSIINLFDL